MIQEVVTEKVILVNPAQETARETQALLDRMAMGVMEKREAEPRFFVSDEPEHFREQGQKYLSRPIRTVVHVGSSDKKVFGNRPQEES